MAPKFNEALEQSEAAATKLEATLGSLATILRPSTAEQPILSLQVRSAIHEWLVEVDAKKELAAVGCKPRSSALLYGPPGTGKTTLAHHLSARLNIPVVLVGSENLIGKYLGDSARNVAQLFDGLKRAGVRCILFVDEIDSIGGKRDEMGEGAGMERVAALNTLLRKVEQFEGMFIGATNRNTSLDSALWRRFGMQIEVGTPDREIRFAIIKKYLAPFEWDDDALVDLAALTEGASPSILRQLVEGLKRRLITGPKLKQPIDTFEAVFRPITASISMPPEFAPPPLWATPDRAYTVMNTHEWPPVLKGGKANG